MSPMWLQARMLQLQLVSGSNSVEYRKIHPLGKPVGGVFCR